VLPSSRKVINGGGILIPKISSSKVEAALFHYRAHVVAVHDGDTCTVDIDLGLMMWKHGETIRLARIDAPELKGSSARKGAKSRDYLKSLIEGRDVMVATIRDKREKYGRYLGEIWLLSGKRYTNVNDVLVACGHARYKSY
jgi:micrococcal nuclease